MTLAPTIGVDPDVRGAPFHLDIVENHRAKQPEQTWADTGPPDELSLGDRKGKVVAGIEDRRKTRSIGFQVGDSFHVDADPDDNLKRSQTDLFALDGNRLGPIEVGQIMQDYRHRQLTRTATAQSPLPPKEAPKTVSAVPRRFHRPSGLDDNTPDRVPFPCDQNQSARHHGRRPSGADSMPETAGRGVHANTLPESNGSGAVFEQQSFRIAAHVVLPPRQASAMHHIGRVQSVCKPAASADRQPPVVLRPARPELDAVDR